MNSTTSFATHHSPGHSPAPAQHALLVQQLSHTYPKTQQPALNDVTLTLPAGESLALLGPNGSGKSTLFRILATLLQPTAGQAMIAGFDCVTQPMAVRNNLGVVFQNPSLDENLSLLENLICHARILGLSAADSKQRSRALLSRFTLDDRSKDKVSTLSGGLTRRVDLARALLASPRVLLLDEPTTGLDPAARREFWQVVQQCQTEQGMTIVAATHMTDEAERFGHVALLDQGKLVALDTPDALRQQIGSEVIEIELVPLDPADQEKVKQQVTALPGVQQVSERESGWLIEVDDGPTRVAGVASVVREQAQRISLGKPTLEDVYLQATGRRLAE